MPHMKKSLPIFLVAAALGAAALLFFAPRSTAPSSKPRVAATIFPIYDIARNVAGTDADVTLILPPGGEPHSYEPSPSTVREVTASAAVYAIGHGVDSWIDPVLVSTGTPKVTVDRGITLRVSQEAISLGAEMPGDAEGGTDSEDPHYWLAVPNAMLIADTIAGDLSARFPSHAAAFRANLAAYRARLIALDAELRDTLKDGRKIVTFHDAWYYFADAYGLEILGTFEPSPGREPTPRALAALRDTVRRGGIKTVFAEPLFSDAAIDAFAKDEGLDIAFIDDIGGTEGRDSYEALMRSNAEIISKSR